MKIGSCSGQVLTGCGTQKNNLRCSLLNRRGPVGEGFGRDVERVAAIRECTLPSCPVGFRDSVLHSLYRPVLAPTGLPCRIQSRPCGSQQNRVQTSRHFLCRALRRHLCATHRRHFAFHSDRHLIRPAARDRPYDIMWLPRYLRVGGVLPRFFHSRYERDGLHRASSTGSRSRSSVSPTSSCLPLADISVLLLERTSRSR